MKSSKNNISNDFAIFILTNGRPDNVVTLNTLAKCGYTGRIYLIIDDLDKTRDEYIERYGDKVIVFDKMAIAKETDPGDNFKDLRAIVYARNASFGIAEKLGLKYFAQFDDDYTGFRFKFDDKLNYCNKGMKRGLDDVLAALMKFYISSGATSIAMSQGGDFIGGSDSPHAKHVMTKRKCMNSFLCRTDRPFKFFGRMNDDVNVYTRLGSSGSLFLTIMQVSLDQLPTQSTAGGSTDAYLEFGTYVKSFYSVMYQPSSVKINMIHTKNKRIHHMVKWKHTAPKIISELYKKKEN